MSHTVGISFFKTAGAPPPPPPSPLPMDTYLTGLLCAYGLRQVLSAYSGALIRVRRSSDNAEQDIQFLSDGSLDTTTLATFCGSGNGFISKWYDQKLSHDAVQTTTTKQPQIVSAGTYLAYIKFDGTDDYLITHTPAVTALSLAANVALSVLPTGTGIASYYCHAGVNTTGNNGIISQYQSDDTRIDTYMFTGSGSFLQERSTGWSSTTAHSITWIGDRSAYPSLTVDGLGNQFDTRSVGTPSAAAYTDQDLYIGSDGAAQSGAFHYSELIIWTSNQSTHTAGITSALA